MLYDMQGIEGHIVKEEVIVEDWLRIMLKMKKGI